MVCQWPACQLAVYKSLDFIPVLQLFCIFLRIPSSRCAGCLCSDCWHWSALCSGRHPSSLPSGGTDRVHHRFFLSYIGARNESQGIIFSVADIGHACFAQDRCEECARSPRPLMRNALLCPFSFVHSLWSITPGAWCSAGSPSCGKFLLPWRIALCRTCLRWFAGYGCRCTGHRCQAVWRSVRTGGG